MRSVTVVLAGVVAAGFVSASSFAADGGTLRYRRGLPPVLEQETGYVGGRELTVAVEKPEVKAEPTYEGTPVYLLIELGERGSPPYLAAYDPKGADGKGCVYFDLDQDNDLAEEEPLALQSWGGSDSFGPIAVKLARDGFVGLYQCWLQRRERQGPVSAGAPPGGATAPADSWWLLPGCYNVGEITLEGKTYKAAMVDACTNGRFDDICWSRLGQGDVLLVDWNGDGKFDVYEQDDYVMVGERYWRDGKWYRLHFRADGTEVGFTPGDFEFAPLVTGHERFWMQVTSRSNTGSVQVEGTGGRVDLPVDEYSLYLSWVEKKDAQGKAWRAQAGYAGPYPVFEVKAGEENRYTFGPPFTVSLKATPEGPYRAGQTISFQVTVVGAEGKTYTLSQTSGEVRGYILSLSTGRMPAPRIVLKDESGKEVGSLQMQSWYSVASWRVTDDVRGKVTATPSMDAGPFEWKAEELVLEVGGAASGQAE